jgi:hypothetical protein
MGPNFKYYTHKSFILNSTLASTLLLNFSQTAIIATSTGGIGLSLSKQIGFMVT